MFSSPFFNRRTIGLAAAVTLAAHTAVAHETWIDAKIWQVAPGDPIAADLINGEMFQGNALPWIDAGIARAEQIDADGTHALTGRLGDVPAISSTARAPGLTTLLYISYPRGLTYDSWDKFVQFLEEKGLTWALDAHVSRGLPRENVREAFSRRIKALVAVGDGAGSDSYRGMDIELVAETNPYADDLTNGMTVRLFYQGAAHAGARVTAFERSPDGSVRTLLAETDADGRAVFDVQSGRTYLMDAVVLREPTRDLVVSERAFWETLWAALTFSVPG